jgi:peptide/nickel transport system substrate-binding protein
VKDEEKLRLGRIDVSTGVTPSGIRELSRSGFRTRRIPSLLLPTLTVIEGTSGPDGLSLGENRLFASALKHAIDYDAIAECFGGWGDGVEPAQTSVLRGMPGYDSALSYFYKHDKRRARRLLRESGYPRGIEIDLTYWEANWGGVDNHELIRIIHSDLEEIGIRGKIRKYQGKEYFELPLEKLRGVTMSMSGYMIPDPDDLMRRRMTWINVSGHDFKAEKQFVAALHQTDAERRSELYRRLQEKFLREGPMIYLLTFPCNVAYNRLLRGYTQPPHWGGPDFSRLHLGK